MNINYFWKEQKNYLFLTTRWRRNDLYVCTLLAVDFIYDLLSTRCVQRVLVQHVLFYIQLAWIDKNSISHLIFDITCKKFLQFIK